VTRAAGVSAPESHGTRVLEGYGAGLVRERAMATAVQRALERLYQLERAADVHAFMTEAEEDQREALLVHDHGDGTIEMALRVPRLVGDTFDVGRGASLDPLCQIIEGVSHFVYIADRARVDREATQLELEMQAEVDKYVVLASAVKELDVRASATLRRRLFEEVSFADAEGSEAGDAVPHRQRPRAHLRPAPGAGVRRPKTLPRDARRAPPVLPPRPGGEATPRPRGVSAARARQRRQPV
jgi:hypothetical protein